MEAAKGKIKRFAFWAVFLIAVGAAAAFVMPPDSLGHFFGLLKDVIINLIL